MADNDRVYHRTGRVGEPDAKVASIGTSAEIRPVGDGTWEIIEEGGVTRATYPPSAICFSVLWKAIRESEVHLESVTLDRVMSIFFADLRRRHIDFRVPSNPLSDSEWMNLLDRIYYVHAGS